MFFCWFWKVGEDENKRDWRNDTINKFVVVILNIYIVWSEEKQSLKKNVINFEDIIILYLIVFCFWYEQWWKDLDLHWILYELQNYCYATSFCIIVVIIFGLMDSYILI